MFTNTIKGLSLFLSLMFVVGCASKGIEVRHYVQVRERADQKIEGNAGFLSGTPQPEDRSQFKKTRNVYVLEVSQGEFVEELEKSDNFVESPRGAAARYFPGSSSEVEIEDYESMSSFKEYVVKKDDTLQKISKKFYDSFLKWPRIYEANKEVIGDPNRIKSGVVLQIPME